MIQSFTGRKRIRKTFGRIPEVAPMPNLIEVQNELVQDFLQMGVPPEQRKQRRAAGSVPLASSRSRISPSASQLEFVQATSSSSRNTTSTSASSAA